MICLLEAIPSGTAQTNGASIQGQPWLLLAGSSPRIYTFSQKKKGVYIPDLEADLNKATLPRHTCRQSFGLFLPEQ